MKRSIKGIGACVFDAYGTLFDPRSVTGGYLERLGSKADGVASLWRTKSLEYTWLRSLMERHADFSAVLEESLDYVLRTFGIGDAGLRDALVEAYLRPGVFPEVPEALNKLKAGGFRLAILSNGSPPMLEAAVKHNGLEDVFERLLSVESAGVFKPHRSVYQLAVDALDVEPHEIAFESSNAWDIAGASSFGFRTVWINRQNGLPERLPFGPDVEIASLAELPGVITRA